MSAPTSQKPGGFGRLSKSLSFWLLLFLVPFVLVQFAGKGTERTTEIDYSFYDQQLTADNIARVTIVGGKAVTGEFKQRVLIQGREVKSFSAKLAVANSETEVERLRAKQVAIKAEEPRPSILGVVLSMLPWIIIIGFWLVMMRNMQAQGGKAFSFGKSKAKLLSGDTPKITFADVAGADEAKIELREIIEFLKDPQKFTKLGGRLPKGALLVGPPGTGKTLLAKAVAGEAGRPFFSMSGSDFVEMFVGVGASRVRDLFEQGKAQAPCIIFIDEIDAVGRHRGAGLGGGHDEREQTLNQLLVEMDGFEGNEGIIVIAATNRPDVLDPALLRPGRFDRQVVVPLPDVRGREQILKVHMRKVPLGEDVKPALIARGTPGFSGADLANLVNEAALFAARANKRIVGMDEFERAKDKIMMGAERRSMVMSEEEKRMTAYHEAGHAIVGISVPEHDPVYKVTIIPRGRALGLTMQLPERDKYGMSMIEMQSRLAILFGGRVAEEMIFGPENVTTGAGGDIQQATALARRMVTEFGMSEKLGRVRYNANEQEVFLGHSVTQQQNISETTADLIDSEVRRLIEEGETSARRILGERQSDLHSIAKGLLEFESLSGDEIGQILRGEAILRPDDDETPRSTGRRSSVPSSGARPEGGGLRPEPQPGA